MSNGIHEFSAQRLNGDEESLADFEGKVVLVVNTASKCGFTPQYKGLEELYQKYKDQGFAVLGFPCNQFGGQEPGEAEEIGAFCEKNYGVSFPMFEKVDVNGDNAHPMFDYLKKAQPGLLGSKKIKWNFTKFLVGKDGVPTERYSPQTAPSNISGDIEKALGA